MIMETHIAQALILIHGQLLQSLNSIMSVLFSTLPSQREKKLLCPNAGIIYLLFTFHMTLFLLPQL